MHRPVNSTGLVHEQGWSYEPISEKHKVLLTVQSVNKLPGRHEAWVIENTGHFHVMAQPLKRHSPSVHCTVLFVM